MNKEIKKIIFKLDITDYVMFLLIFGFFLFVIIKDVFLYRVTMLGILFLILINLKYSKYS